MHGRRWPTPCNVSRGRSTWCLAQTLPSAWQTFVEFISPQQIDWFWSHTLHLRARSLQGAILYSLRHRADAEAKVVTIPIPASPMVQYVSVTTESVHATNQNPLKSSFSVEVWDNILTYTLNPSWVIITIWQICINACRQFVAHCASTFNCRLWRNFRTGEHTSRLEYIICSDIFLPIFSSIHCWILIQYCIRIEFFMP